MQINLDIKLSKFIKRFIIADAALFAGWGFVDPIFSVFLVREIAGASLVTVGIATAIYWILKSALQVPIAVYLDKTDGERDDFNTLIAALVVVGVGAMSFALATKVWHIYLIQIIKAVGFAMYVSSWPALFSRHLDKKHTSLDWSLDSTSVGLAIGATGLLSGVVATWLGYSAVFILAGIFSFVSAAILFSVPDIIFPPKIKAPHVLVKDHAPRNLEK
jgi:predicted MFS family arabinose efflux permease